MEILLVAAVNVAFILFVYISFSKRLRSVESSRLPEELRNEVNQLVTSFNRTANTNIDLLDDRISALTPLVEKAAKQLELLSGELKRAEALKKQRDEQLKQQLELLEQRRAIAGNAAEIQKSAAAYSAAVESGPQTQFPAKPQKKAVQAKKSKKTGKTADKRKPRRRKSNDEKIMELLEDGLSPEEISQKVKLPVEAVRLKVRLLQGRPRSNESP